MSTITVSKWVRVNRCNPCLVCGKPDWCLISQDAKATICARIESDKPAGTKGAGWVHVLNAATPLPRSRPRLAAKQNPKTAPGILDIAYRALLSELTLSKSHHENLQRRSLTEAQIASLGYKTLPTNGRRELAARLQANGIRLAGVPGFYLEAGHWQLAGPVGIAIPVRDTKQRVMGLQIHCDNAEGGRYKWLSSRGFNAGCSPGTPVHVAGTVSVNGEVWVTEGPVKADIAALKLGRLVLAVAGVGNWLSVIPIIRELKPKRAIIAFDMDKISNHTVKLHSEALMTCLIRGGIRTFEADWDSHFKGLDDLLTGEELCPR
ncbi:MAG: hypothetical protein WBE46_06365 [Dehalococcoidia bacterium]